MAIKTVVPALPLYSATISNTTTVYSNALKLRYMTQSQAGLVVTIGGSLSATFQLQVSNDGATYYNSGQVLPSVTAGSPASFEVQYNGAFPFIRLAIIPSSGTGAVVVVGCAKGSA
jgi:hypothetical protein